VIAVGHNPIVWLVLELLNLYWWVVIIAVVVSWLVAFGVINTYHPTARAIVRALAALTEPVFRPIRRILPSLGGLDLSPLIVLIAISFLEYAIQWAEVRYFPGSMA
jgi:YggT family protein